MKIEKDTLLFWGLHSDFNEPIPKAIVEEMLADVPLEVHEVKMFPQEHGAQILVPFIASDAKIYYYVFNKVKMRYGDFTVELSKMSSE